MWILRFFTRQINPRYLGSWCVKGTEESTSRVDSSVPLTHHDPKDLGLICLVKKHKIHFRILSDLRIQSWIFLKKRTRRNAKPRKRITFDIQVNTALASPFSNEKHLTLKVHYPCRFLPNNPKKTNKTEKDCSQ